MSKPRKCPNCGSFPYCYIEHHNSTIEWEANEKGIPITGHDEGVTDNGSPAGIIEAKCLCGNRWKLRGIIDIYDIKPKS